MSRGDKKKNRLENLPLENQSQRKMSVCPKRAFLKAGDSPLYSVARVFVVIVTMCLMSRDIGNKRNIR